MTWPSPDFAEFGRSAAWRALPLRIQLALFHLERAESEAVDRQIAER